MCIKSSTSLLLRHIFPYIMVEKDIIIRWIPGLIAGHCLRVCSDKGGEYRTDRSEERRGPVRRVASKKLILEYLLNLGDFEYADKKLSQRVRRAKPQDLDFV